MQRYPECYEIKTMVRQCHMITVVLFTFSLDELKSRIEENMERRGDKIASYGDDCKFICFG